MRKSILKACMTRVVMPDIRVTRDGKNVACVVTFAFAFFAFNPDGILHARKRELRQSH